MLESASPSVQPGLFDRMPPFGYHTMKEGFAGYSEPVDRKIV
jgi:hypothetical protein